MKKAIPIRFALSGNQLRFSLLLLAGLFANLLASTADPLLTKTLIDNIARHDFHAFLLLSLTVVLFGVALRVVLLFYGLACQRLQNRIAQTLTLKMLAKYYATHHSAISHSSNGYFVSRVYDEPAKVAQGAITVWLTTGTSVVTFLGSLAITLYLSWQITLLLAAVVPLLYYISRQFSPKIRQQSQAENEGEAKLREFLGRAIESYKTVKLFDLFPSIYERVASLLRYVLDTTYSRAQSSRSYQTFSAIFLSCAETLVLVAAGYAVLHGNLTLGGLFGFMSAFWKLINAGTEVIKEVPELSRQGVLVQRLLDFVALPDEELARERVLPSGMNVAECESVSVSLGKGTILENVNLSVGRNERLLILGPNGSGKTTIANLLAQFAVISAGTVKGPPRTRISALLAPFYFVPGTLLENVNFALLSDRKRAIFEALVDQLGLHKTLVADLSSSLSEGEKRKCQVLMTLLKDADLYIFDEPLTNIDNESKHLILHTVIDYTKGKSLVVIMHGDFEYWSLFDRIVEMKQMSIGVSLSALECGDRLSSLQM